MSALTTTPSFFGRTVSISRNTSASPWVNNASGKTDIDLGMFVTESSQHTHPPTSSFILLGHLGSDQFTLTEAINISLNQVDDEFIASVVDVNINASGETFADALTNIMDMIVSLYQCLEKEPYNSLGPLPARQLAFLKSKIRKNR